MEACVHTHTHACIHMPARTPACTYNEPYTADSHAGSHASAHEESYAADLSHDLNHSLNHNLDHSLNHNLDHSLSAAEEAIDAHLSGARAVLSNAMAVLRTEHEAERTRTLREIGQLRAQLQLARQREAELEGKLASIGSVMMSQMSDAI